MSAALLSLLVAASALVPAALLVAAAWSFERRDRDLVLGCVVAGALGLALGVTWGWRLPAAALGAVIAAEAARGAVLLWLWGRRQVDSPVAGALAGTCCGAAAAAGELAVRPPGSDGFTIPAALGAALALAMVLGAAASLTGSAVGAERLLPSPWRFLSPFAGLAAAVAVSMFGRALLASGQAIEAAGLGLGVLALSIAAGMGFESRILGEELREEIEMGSLDADLGEILHRPWRRLRHDWWPESEGRTRFVAVAAQLALARRRQRRLLLPQRRLYQLELWKLRERIQALLRLRPRRRPLELDREGMDLRESQP